MCRANKSPATRDLLAASRRILGKHARIANKTLSDKACYTRFVGIIIEKGKA